MHKRILIRATGLALAVFMLPALADPPAHAKAHGWRKKHDPYYEGYTGKKWRDDYGIRDGRCDGTRILAAMAGHKTADAVERSVGGDAGLIIGTIAGVLVEAKISRKMDRIDRGCVSHALDLAPSGRTVRWTNPDTDRRYSITPRETRRIDGRLCRDLDWSTGLRQTACLDNGGSWRVIRR